MSMLFLHIRVYSRVNDMTTGIFALLYIYMCVCLAYIYTPVRTYFSHVLLLISG